jgi:hypothetical protein
MAPPVLFLRRLQQIDPADPANPPEVDRHLGPGAARFLKAQDPACPVFGRFQAVTTTSPSTLKGTAGLAEL